MTTPTTGSWPTLRARDAGALITWLTDVLGFTETVCHRDDSGRVAHAELAWPTGGGLMLGDGPADPAAADPWALEPGSAGVYLVLPDAAAVDALHARAVAAGATEVRAPFDTDYGSHDTAVRDPEGNRWSVGTYPGHAAQQG
jgi:uncharacterized glyoxalase superfamily protein PhnB